MTFVLILHFDWLQGPHIGQNFEKHSKIFSSETVKGMKPILCMHVPDSGLYIICVFYSSGGFRGGSGGSLEPPSAAKLFHFHGEF